MAQAPPLTLIFPGKILRAYEEDGERDGAVVVTANLQQYDSIQTCRLPSTGRSSTRSRILHWNVVQSDDSSRKRRSAALVEIA